MTKRKTRAKKVAPNKDQARFECQVAELKTTLEKPAADRQEQFRRGLEPKQR